VQHRARFVGIGAKKIAPQWIARRVCRATTVDSGKRMFRTFFNDLEKRDGIPNPFARLRAPARLEGLQREGLRSRRLAAENLPWASEYDRALAVALFGTMLYAALWRGEPLRLTSRT